jgi:hypothetical protein
MPRPHTEIGQQNQSTSGGIGGYPKQPPAIPNFLPMTPGFEAAQRGANDALSGAEGAYAVGRTMIPAQLGLQKQRLTTDMGVATDRLREDLAGRGVYTAKNAQGTYGGTSPAGGGIGQSLYTQKVATPYGRQFQDLASQGAAQYGDLANSMGGAMLGYNQNIMQGLLDRAAQAYQDQPLSLGLGGYDLPHLPAPQFPGAAGIGGGGRTRPRSHRGARGRRGGK